MHRVLALIVSALLLRQPICPCAACGGAPRQTPVEKQTACCCCPAEAEAPSGCCAGSNPDAKGPAASPCCKAGECKCVVKESRIVAVDPSREIAAAAGALAPIIIIPVSADTDLTPSIARATGPPFPLSPPERLAVLCIWLN